MSDPGYDDKGSFVEYARMQHELGVRLAQEHTVEATGCCRACGRVYPCDAYQYGQDIQAHYRSWLLEPTLSTPAVVPTFLAEPGPQLA